MSVVKTYFKDNTRKCYQITIPGMLLHFSFETCIGVTTHNERIRLKNIWGPTTGKHINKLDIKDYDIVSEEELNKAILKSIAHTGSQILDKRLQGNLQL